ncbi:DUF1963 domain-containing protein [Flavobacterium sp. CBA20B-1]|uniref:YwqG family protein n=1 Tax=unclassified Flavobacterium TaxID=196869 RepID=UPI0022240A0D|nr:MULTISPECIES: YwqG family protein [unclassified Flavobacterium]WCM42671.1 DUF1963 domain-containing protein [Flavobacterium sp. CBA20B-1]
MNKTELKALFNKNNLQRIWTILEPNLKNSILISPVITEDENIEIGKSKIGGCPDLPNVTSWFEYQQKPMSFLAQINLSEVTELDLDQKLPKKGMLYFFYDADQEVWGFDPKDKEGAKVFFYDGDFSALERKQKPKNLDEYSFFNSCSLSFKSTIDMLDYQSDLLDNMVLEDDEETNYENLMEELYQDEVFKLLGHSNNVQGGMELECELVTNGINCGSPVGYQSSKSKELEKNIQDWNLLFQMDSSDDVGTMWGDCGRIYFWIKDNDLAVKNFDNAWAILQCY